MIETIDIPITDLMYIFLSETPQHPQPHRFVFFHALEETRRSDCDDDGHDDLIEGKRLKLHCKYRDEHHYVIIIIIIIHQHQY